MKKLLTFYIVSIVAVSSFLIAYTVPYLSDRYLLSDLQNSLLIIITIILAGAFMAGIFEYIFSLPFYNFLNIIEKTWEKHHSLDNISTADLPDELNASLNTFKAIVEKSSKRINELESKSGYSEEYYRLITTISHQLRTPTTGLRWALESLRDDMTKEKPI